VSWLLACQMDRIILYGKLQSFALKQRLSACILHCSCASVEFLEVIIDVCDYAGILPNAAVRSKQTKHC